MSAFGERFLSDLRATLNRGDHDADDFDLSQGFNSDFKNLTVTYRFHPSLYCELRVRTRAATKTHSFILPQQIETEAAGTIHVVCSPGEILKVEHLTYEDASATLQAIREWADRIRAELLAIPINRRVEEQRKQLEELTAQFEDIEEGYFTAEEAEKLTARLDAFEKQFAERIQADAESKGEADRRISDLRRDVENLKQQLQMLDRKGWIKSAVVRISRWGSDPTNRQLVKSTSDLAKSLLLPSGPGGDNP